MRRALSVGMMLIFLAVVVAAPLYAAESSAPQNPLAKPTKISEWAEEDGDSPPGELMIFDALVLRPLGVAAIGAGLVGSVVTMPWAATSNSGNRVANEMLKKPFNYTFTRPMGDVD